MAGFFGIGTAAGQRRLRTAFGAWAWLLVLIGGALSSSAGNFRAAKLAEIDAAITAAIKEQKLPGAVFWLEREGEVYLRAYGHRALLPSPLPMETNTLFDVASLTKAVATTPALLRLVEMGRVRVDDPVQRYLPELKGEGTREILVRHLLTHTSGYRPGLTLTNPWTGYDTAIRLAAEEFVTNAPGSTFRYSDINYILLGEIVRRAGGQPLQEFVAREIFQPARMRDTGFLPDPAAIARVAPTEKVDGEILRGVVHDPTARRMGGVAGHAGVFSTAADLARFAHMLLHHGVLDGVKVLSPESARLMTTVQTGREVFARRSFGLDVDSPYSRPRGKLPLGSFGHTGWTGTCFWIDPYSRTFFVFLSNRVHPDGTGNVLSLYPVLGTLVAEAVEGFDFSDVPGSVARQKAANGALTRLAAAGPASAPAPAPDVLTGIDVLVQQNFAPLQRKRIGLITNHTGTDRGRNATIDLLFHAPGVQLKALFSPEHGIRGLADASVNDSIDEKTGLPVYSLYPRLPAKRATQSEAEYEREGLLRRAPAPRQLADLDALVFDIQDIGCRFYTYTATMGNCLEAAARAHLPFFVLDRPNPIGGVRVEGPVYRGHPSFVAYHSLPLRHGMTLGELARMFNAERHFGAELTVVPLQNWSRAQWFDETGLPWINPSPNMRSLAAAILYPGLGLLESALSVGRGTEHPFERVGAPYADEQRLAAELNRAGLLGVRFEPIRFTPTASTFATQSCGGVTVIVTDRRLVDAVEVGLEVALTWQRIYPSEFALKKMASLLRDAPTLDAIRAGRAREDIRKLWRPGLEEFERRREAFLLYR